MPISLERRRFLKRAGLTVASAAAVPGGGFAGDGVESARQPDYFSTKGSQVGVLYLNHPQGKELGDQLSFRGQLRAQAKTVAAGITPPPLGKDTVQGTADNPVQPVVDIETVAKFALLAAEIQYGANGREVVAETILRQRLIINYEDQEPTPALDGHPQPLRITLSPHEKLANIPELGLERGDRTDDFELANKVNETVRQIVQDTAAAIVASNGLPAQLAALGIVGGAAGLATVGTSAEPIARRSFLRWGAVGAASAGAFLATERLNWGKQMVEAINSGAVEGSDLGTGYTQPSDTFRPLLQSNFFTTEIRGQLIVPTPTEQVYS